MFEPTLLTNVVFDIIYVMNKYLSSEKPKGLVVYPGPIVSDRISGLLTKDGKSIYWPPVTLLTIAKPNMNNGLGMPGVYVNVVKAISVCQIVLQSIGEWSTNDAPFKSF